MGPCRHDLQADDAVVRVRRHVQRSRTRIRRDPPPEDGRPGRAFARSLPTPALILDAGCGPGRDLARFTSMAHVARGINLNPEFVAMARAQAQTSCADLRRVGSTFPLSHFDGVWSRASLVHLNETEARDVLGQFFASCVREAGSTPASTRSDVRFGSTNRTAGDDCIREHDAFAEAVGSVGLSVGQVVRRPFVEVWATRGGLEE